MTSIKKMYLMIISVIGLIELSNVSLDINLNYEFAINYILSGVSAYLINNKYNRSLNGNYSETTKKIYEMYDITLMAGER